MTVKWKKKKKNEPKNFEQTHKKIIKHTHTNHIIYYKKTVLTWLSIIQVKYAGSYVVFFFHSI